ncbi:thiamine pyrophosphate-dependent dehydrogenase E1 component subunit alpha [Verrucomicrobiales bacterium]|nr:thiamine pyrophosphate-dependent dehydrogenase E1 component subunit alpha [Verrucomicrobiales bacterium]
MPLTNKYISCNFFPDLGDLADADNFHQPIDLNNTSPDLLREFINLMIKIRCAEEKIADAVTEGLVKCPCHLVIGQEAVPTGLAPHIQKGDKVFGAHRSHAHYLALGGDLYQLFAEIQGKDDGCSKGMGGSMHLIDKKNQLFGTVPIVGATIPIATGAGLAAKMSNKEEIAISFFGDGACEEGVLHESLNLASTLNLPVIFFCENNLFSSHLHISLRQPSNSVARYANAHHIPSIILDGNDAVAIYEATKEAVTHCRKGQGPIFIEAVTYRWRGHVGAREDTDVGVKRQDDLQKWRKRDPISRLQAGMVKGNLSDNKFIEAVWDHHKIETDLAWEKATQAQYPDNSELINRVYSLNK